MNRKCIGCGAYLVNDPNSLGYTPKLLEDTKYCARCFKLKNYNQVDNLAHIDLDHSVTKIIQNIDFSNLKIFMVLDILDLEHTIIDELLAYEQQIVFLINKIDLLPAKYNADLIHANVKTILANHGFKHSEILYCSTKNKTSLKRIYDQIEDATKHKQKSIFFGKSNVGKSSLINALLTLNKQDPTLTVSSFTNTTLHLNKVMINKNTILDSPGISFTANILNYINPKDNKYVMVSYDSKFVNYQLEPKQSLLISGLVGIMYLEGEKTTITLYLSNELDIRRSKLENFEKNWTNRSSLAKYQYLDDCTNFKDYEFNLDPNKKNNINIAGLGLLVINAKASKIKIRVYEKVGVKLASAAII
ncbi:ribosome biogenesis GTPase YqeH [Ureaplasma diversum]|uniref:Uncharacterized protein n=1 Tax=Ureaplasma diversum NCTC 246 TaxID=1188241 RepID=A0A084F1F7_9BACT|nr:ribosome biogenesis GTPase YqeH [Ureaplasma diversum]KEZ24049.1 Hypothetical protein, putative GTPase EngC [Ureaplasma diversum NCTC 246]